MAFLKAFIFASALVTVCNGGYPKMTAILADPQVYDHGFLSGRYDANEIYIFNKEIYLDAVIVPTRIVEGNNSEPYQETYYILIEATDKYGDYGYHEDVATGFFSGTVTPGSSVSVPIRSINNTQESLLASPSRNGDFLEYVIYVQYGRMAMSTYPVFQNRSFEFLTLFQRAPEPYGVIVGLEYSKP